MLDATVRDMLVDQVNKEFYSAYLYLDISNYFYEEGLEGFGNYYAVQAKEEQDHAMLFLGYLRNNGVRVPLPAIAGIDKEILSHTDAMETVLNHERYVTELIHALYSKSRTASDFRTLNFLDWFVTEQGEEENAAEALIRKYKLFAKDGAGLLALDKELAARVYSPPTLVL